MTEGPQSSRLPPTELQKLLGVTIQSTPEETMVRFAVRPEFCNRRGVLQGGIICVLFDIAMGVHMRANGGPGVTLELKTQFLHPVGLGEVVCHARYLRAGRNICFLVGELTDGTRVCASATATWQRLRQPTNE